MVNSSFLHWMGGVAVTGTSKPRSPVLDLEHCLWNIDDGVINGQSGWARGGMLCCTGLAALLQVDGKEALWFPLSRDHGIVARTKRVVLKIG